MAEDLSGFSMLELFRLEADTQTAVLSAGILAIERLDQSAQTIEAMMRAAHSLKGAARIVGVEPAVEVSHALEDCFVAAGRGEIQVRPEHADVLLACVDFLASIGRADDALLPDGPWPGRAMALVAALGRMHSLPEELFPLPSAQVAAPALLPEIPDRFPTPAPLPLSPTPARDEVPPVAILVAILVPCDVGLVCSVLATRCGQVHIMRWYDFAEHKNQTFVESTFTASDPRCSP